ncbi:tellurite resistance TerB C-terminal domain-containing protein [Alkalinema pantanalense CENA528]|uniref:tellurite resistance TerB C-terminal domain-containing protein n=1 Tax=Alkalinema pantanalense TaxID=1620705 RepID=UPI003D70073C
MSGNRFLLSSVAFGISFGVSLVFSKGDWGKAFGTGCLAFVGSQVGAIVASRQAEDALTWRIDELKGHIRALQRKRSEAYIDLLDVIEEHDRIIANINSLQSQTKQMKAQNAVSHRSTQPFPSWDLSVPTQRRTTAEIQDLDSKIKELEQEEAAVNESLTITLAAKQRAELSLTTTQAELKQVQQKVAEQQKHQTRLQQDIQQLQATKQKLEHELSQLQEQVTTLEQYRTELDRLVSAAEPTRQQVEAGAQSLQGAIDQLQQQIRSLHGELGQLEDQILERRTQKEDLDRELTSLRQQQQQLSISATPPQPVNSTSTHSSFATAWQGAVAQNGHPGSHATSTDPAAPIDLDLSQAALSPDWITFVHQLPHYELQALCAIAQATNPASTLKQIAESNLTMPELLIDAINEQALEAIGDLILETTSETNTPIIAQEYRSTIAKVVQAYEASQKTA